MKNNFFWSQRRGLGDKANKMWGEWAWQWQARRTQERLERNQIWDMVEPYERPKSLAPLLLLNTAAFYTGVIGAAVMEQLHKVLFYFDASTSLFLCARFRVLGC